nr:hypothetical protein [Synergistaceae bacterium]
FYPDRKGWFIKLAEKERMSTPPKLLSGHVFFFTFIPDDDICSDNGKTRFYILNEKNGKSAWDPIEETTKKYKEYPGKKVTGFDLRSNPGGGVSAILADGSVLPLILNLETPSIVGEPLYWKSR